MILKKDGIKGKTTLAEIGSCVQVVKHSYGTFSFLYYFSGGGAWGGVGNGHLGIRPPMGVPLALLCGRSLAQSIAIPILVRLSILDMVLILRKYRYE